MRATRVWKRLVGVDDRTVIEGIEFEDTHETVVVHMRPRGVAAADGSSRRLAGSDDGDGRRRWRGLDLGTVKMVLEADAPRVGLSRARCDGGCGVVGAPRDGVHPRPRGADGVAGVSRTARTCSTCSCGRCSTKTPPSRPARCSRPGWRWASRSKLPAFVKLARTVRKHKVRIYAAVAHRLTNATGGNDGNQKLRLIMRRAFEFRSIDALIGLAWARTAGLDPAMTLESPRLDNSHAHEIRRSSP